MEIIDFSSCCNFDNNVYPLQYSSNRFRRDDLKWRTHVLYDGDIYVVKMRQNNGYECFGEYIGSHIFNILGIPAQKTLLGVIDCLGKKIPAVACKLLNTGTSYICDFSEVINKFCADMNPYSLEYYFEIAKRQKYLDSNDMIKRIWQVLVVDAYIGNYDGFKTNNWRMLWTEERGFSMLPVIDNGNCLGTRSLELNPSLVVSMVGSIRNGNYVTEATEIVMCNFDETLWKGKKINFANFFQNIDDKNCFENLGVIVERIEAKEQEINQMIDDAPLIPDMEKQFYKLVLHQRKRDILQRGLKSLRGKMI